MSNPSTPHDARDRALRFVDLSGVTAHRTAPLPFCLRVVLENVIRNASTPADRALAERIANWRPGSPALVVPLKVDRVVLPDSSGLPVLLDFAALRDALAEAGAIRLPPSRKSPAS